MPLRIIASHYFEKQLRRLYKKFPQVADEIEALTEQLQRGENPGTLIPHTGYIVYKVRLANRDAGKGKQGGFRVIYLVETTLYIAYITIYAKTEKVDLAPEEIADLIEQFLEEDPPAPPPP
ncbi:MAG: type II toxin-antitoxin system RelE/ParE family toxin [Anaerolineae bacterium]|nr:type II toxin-antitoxin system RelE/ParE family toxin [Anaerolineae bacterium]